MHRRINPTVRAVLGALCAISLLLTLTASAFAAEPTDASTAGEPSIDASRPTGYYIWHDVRGFHLRTHGPGREHRFEARLHSDGTFTDVSTVRLESRDDVAVTDGGHTLVLTFHTFDATDGVDFRVRGGERLRFNLRLDGAPIGTESIFLGAHGRHPRSNPFTIPL